MEGYAVANAAREHGSRFASARAILDSSELDLPTGVMSTNALKLALRAVASPHLVPRMVALANAVNAVQTSLERLFRCFLEETFSD
jgi:hypothetical protein